MSEQVGDVVGTCEKDGCRKEVRVYHVSEKGLGGQGTKFTRYQCVAGHDWMPPPGPAQR